MRDYDSAGYFRKVDASIYGQDFSLTPSELIEPELIEIINSYYAALENGNHPFEEAALFHYRFEMIHPFKDGNGRVGREIFNFMLSKQGYPKLLILRSNREGYLKILQLGNEEKYAEMIAHFACLLTFQRGMIFLGNSIKNWLSLAKKEQSFSYSLSSHFMNGEWDQNKI
jgi:Fic family protein